MMRKAEMAAKVTQIKRLSELEMADESEEDEAHLQTAPSYRLRLPANCHKGWRNRGKATQLTVSKHKTDAMARPRGSSRTRPLLGGLE